MLLQLVCIFVSFLGLEPWCNGFFSVCVLSFWLIIIYSIQNIFIFCCWKLSQLECLSLLSINSYFNPFFLLSKSSLQVERGRRTNEEVESCSGRKRERNCKPSKTVAGKVSTEVSCVVRSVCIVSVYLYVYMCTYCLFSFNRMCKRKTNLLKLKFKN